MTDYFNDLNFEGGTTNPITRAGRVAQNYFLDIQELLQRRNSKNSYYKGTLDDRSFNVAPQSILLGKRASSFTDSNVKDIVNEGSFVFSSLNGAFNESDELWKIISEHEFKGISTAHMTEFDSLSKNPEVDLAGSIGGLDTIINTGNVPISNGSLVYWTLPESEDGNPESTGFSNGQILPEVRPYETTMDSLTLNTLKKLMLKSNTDLSGLEVASKIPLLKAADDFKFELLTNLLLSAHILQSSGLVTFNTNSTTQKAARDKYNKSEKEDLIELASYLGIDREEPERPRPKEEFIFDIKRNGNGGSPDKIELIDYSLKVFCGMDAQILFPYINNRPPPKIRGILDKKQKFHVEKLLSIINSANQTVKDRIFAKAMSTANPGHPFDVYLGNWSF